MVFGAVGALAFLILFLVAFGNPDNALHKTALDNAFMALIAVIGVYIGAPVVDDWLHKDHPHSAA